MLDLTIVHIGGIRGGGGCCVGGGAYLLLSHVVHWVDVIVLAHGAVGLICGGAGVILCSVCLGAVVCILLVGVVVLIA